ncbi:MAG: hypothetical protein AB7O96_17630 [Pseudobdellovibrionaceae bacterium]
MNTLLEEFATEHLSDVLLMIIAEKMIKYYSHLDGEALSEEIDSAGLKIAIKQSEYLKRAISRMIKIAQVYNISPNRYAWSDFIDQEKDLEIETDRIACLFLAKLVQT